MTTRVLVLATLLMAAAPPAGAAQRATGERTAEPAPAAQAPVDAQTARETRERLLQILQQYPPSVGQVLRLDPSLLAKPDYLAPYPTLAAYLGQHPEVAHNPTFFLGGAFGGPQQFTDLRTRAVSSLESVFIGLEVLLGFIAAVAAVSWIIRGAIDYRRWLRATKVQVDAHTKIVDRLASNEDLLAYMNSAAGQHFLTAMPMAAPASFDAALPVNAPINRILWSVQAGVVLTVAGAGLFLARNGVIDEAAQAMQVLATLIMALGIGFVLSALASWALSRQFGLLASRADHA